MFLEFVNKLQPEKKPPGKMGASLILMTPNQIRLKAKYPFRLLRAFKFRKHNYQYTEAYKNGWDGYISFAHMLNDGAIVIPTGLYPYLKQFVDVEIDYPELELQERFPSKIKMRDYQKLAVNNMIKHKRGIVQLATGAGKTFIALEFIRRVKGSTIFIVNRKDLLIQTIEKAKEFGFKNIGVIGAGEFQPTYDFDVAMIQTLNRIDDPEFFEKYDILIIDECHQLNFNSKVNKKTIAKFRNAWFRFGLSATPFRYDLKYADDITLVGLIGFPVFVMKEIEGFTAPVEVRFLPITYTNKKGFRSGIYLAYGGYRERVNIIKSIPQRIKLIKALVEKHKEDKVLIIAPSVAHAKTIAEHLGDGVIHVSGKLKKKTRKERYLQFREKPKAKCVATTVYDEGVDFPDLDVIIFTEPFKSYLKVIQRVGRGRRLADGKDKVIVYDLADDLFPAQNRERETHYKKEGFSIKVLHPVNITLDY